MTSTQLDPVGAGYHPSAVDRNAEEDERDNATNLDLLEVQKQDTVDAEEYNAESESEKGNQTGQEKPRHVGFWAHN